MTSEPKQNRPAPSGARGKNLYQKMEEARARRAEVLALKQPANDDATVTLTAKGAHKPTPEPAPTADAHPAPEPKPEAQPRSRPRSRPESERFPAILMPQEFETEVDPAAPKRGAKSRLMTLAFLLFALIAGVLYFAPQSPGPFATQTILAPTTSDPSIGTTVPTLDSEVRISNTVTLGSGPSATLGPLRGTVPQRPEAAVAIVPVRTLDVPSTNTVTPSNANLWETSAAPFMPVAPTNDPIFALAENVALNVSLIVPAQASREKLRDISEALLATGFEINEPRLVTYKVTTTQVRYFHDRDAKAAAKLADDIGGTVRDFTDFNPSPPLGFVEVFIEESPSASPQKPAPRGLPGDLRQFGNDVRETLRSITR